MKLYKLLAMTAAARLRCNKNGHVEWFEINTNRLEQLAKEYLPSGSGIDTGCEIDLDNTMGEKIVIESQYHALDEYGSYIEWVDFTVTVTPSLQYECVVDVQGGDLSRHDGLKDYLVDVFAAALDREVDE
jgi:hypothetical protein